MSYCCYISFKTIEVNEVCNFLVNLKKEAKAALKEIANENYRYSPFSRRNVEYIEDFQDEYSPKRQEIFKEAEAWANKCFTFKWFYREDIKLLGIMGIPTCLYKLFDCNVCFQNSVDQDYEFSTWNGIPLFEEIAKKWESKTDDEMYEIYSSKGYCFEDKEEFCKDHAGYYRRDYAYDEIWEMFSNYLYDDDSTVDVTLINHRDADLTRYIHLCLTEYEMWVEKIEKEIAESRKKKEE